MTSPDCVRFEWTLPALRSRILKRATGERCECCGGDIPSSLLEVHCIPGMEPEKDAVDLFLHILLLCPGCHVSMHRLEISPYQQHLLVKARRQETAGRMQKAFLPGRSYSPPECLDPADLFASALTAGGIDLFLNGA